MKKTESWLGPFRIDLFQDKSSFTNLEIDGTGVEIVLVPLDVTKPSSMYNLLITFKKKSQAKK